MAIRDIVVQATRLVMEAAPSQDPRHRLMGEILLQMPLYLEIRDLGSWEAAFQAVMPGDKDTSSTGVMLEEVFDFGRGSMYGAFDPASARVDYDWLRSRLAMYGVHLPLEADLSGW